MGSGKGQAKRVNLFGKKAKAIANSKDKIKDAREVVIPEIEKTIEDNRLTPEEKIAGILNKLSKESSSIIEQIYSKDNGFEISSFYDVSIRGRGINGSFNSYDNENSMYYEDLGELLWARQWEKLNLVSMKFQDKKKRIISLHKKDGKLFLVDNCFVQPGKENHDIIKLQRKINLGDGSNAKEAVDNINNSIKSIKADPQIYTRERDGHNFSIANDNVFTAKDVKEVIIKSYRPRHDDLDTKLKIFEVEAEMIKESSPVKEARGKKLALARKTFNNRTDAIEIEYLSKKVALRTRAAKRKDVKLRSNIDPYKDHVFIKEELDIIPGNELNELNEWKKKQAEANQDKYKKAESAINEEYKPAFDKIQKKADAKISRIRNKEAVIKAKADGFKL